MKHPVIFSNPFEDDVVRSWQEQTTQKGTFASLSLMPLDIQTPAEEVFGSQKFTPKHQTSGRMAGCLGC